jgi:hypothetical protein
MTAPAMAQALAAAAGGLIESQLVLDERGRDSLDAFDETGVPPTVLAWSHVRLSCPVTLGFGHGPADARVAAGGSGVLRLGFRFLPSEQGGDDPRPAIPGPS